MVYLLEDRLYVGVVWYVLHDSSISGQVEVCVRQCQAHTCTYGLLVSLAYCTIPVYTAVFLEMNPQVRNVEDTINQNTSLEKVHLFILYNYVTMHRAKKT
jgi:hypothetical protein